MYFEGAVLQETHLGRSDYYMNYHLIMHINRNKGIYFVENP